MKEKMRLLRDFIVQHSKIAFPIIIIVVVAITVALALGAGNADESEPISSEPEVSSSTAETVMEEDVVPEIILEQNENGAIYTLVAIYYNAFANGDTQTIQTITDTIDDRELIKIEEFSKYVESYPTIEIYFKPGPIENSYVIYVYTQVTFYGHTQLVPGLETFYVCTDEAGNLYFNKSEMSDEVLEYIGTINLQDDVVELNNKVNAEYNDLMTNDEKLFEYLSEVAKQVDVATGERLAGVNQGSADGSGAGSDGTTDGSQSSGDGSSTAQDKVYGKATTTVNVRSSDSENADKLGKLTTGERVQITEHRANGWSQIVYNGKVGYVKSEYLQVEGNADGGSITGSTSGSNGDAIRTATATTNVNLRKEPSETATKLGVVVGGESLEVLSEYNGWSQVRYKGTIGYVKSDYIQ